jgi:single-strand DNA-binding protein
MANNTNNITLVGNVTREPETRFTPSGKQNTTFGLAVNRSWRNQQTQEWEERTSFFNVITWDQLADHVSSSIGKGTRVLVTGRLEQRSWETDQGDKRSTVEIVADEVGPSLRFATADVHKVERSGPGEGGGGGGGQRRQPAATPSAGGGGGGENYDQYGEEPF